MTYVFSHEEIKAQDDEVKKHEAMIETLTRFSNAAPPEIAPMTGAFFAAVAQTLGELARDLRANIQVLDEISRGGPVGVRLAVRRTQGEIHPPWPGATPVRFRKTALGEQYEYELGTNQVIDLIRLGLGFDSTYKVEFDQLPRGWFVCVDRGEKA